MMKLQKVLRTSFMFLLFCTFLAILPVFSTKASAIWTWEKPNKDDLPDSTRESWSAPLDSDFFGHNCGKEHVAKKKTHEVVNQPGLGYVYISSGFGPRDIDVEGASKDHKGIDIIGFHDKNINGVPVYATRTGKVTYKQNTGDISGNTIEIEHKIGNDIYMSRYLHLDRFEPGFKKNDVVHQGQLIGYVGGSGGVKPHLHFSLAKYNGTKFVEFDPTPGKVVSYMKHININDILGSVASVASEIIKDFSPEALYLKQCKGPYDTCVKIQVIKDNAPVWSIPCSDATDKSARQLQKMKKGSYLNATEIWCNTQGNYWYKVEINGGTGYIYGANTNAVGISDDVLTSDSTIKLATRTPKKGSSCRISGTYKTNSATIISVKGVLDSTKFSNPSNQRQTVTVTVKGHSLDIQASNINKKLKFGELPAGKGSLSMSAVFEAKYIDGTVMRTKQFPEMKLHTLEFTVK